MMETEIRRQLMDLLKDKMQRLDIREKELVPDFDLVKSGFVNSLEFVELVASLEKLYQVEVDFEETFAKGDLTTVGGLIRTIIESK